MLAGVEGAAPQYILPTVKIFGEEGGQESTSMAGGSMTLQVKVEVPGPIARDMPMEQKTGSRRWTHQRWVSAESSKEVETQGASTEYNLVFRTKMLHKGNSQQDR